MICSKCAGPVRPIIAFDIDNTSADYTGNLIRFAEGYFGCGFPPAERYVGQCRIGEYLGLSDTDYRAMKLAYRQGGGKRTQPVTPGITDLVAQLRRRGVEIWVTTTRPYNRLDSTDPDTRWWLEYHDFQYDHLLYDDDKYGVLDQIIGERSHQGHRVIAVVEDLVENYDRAYALGLNPILATWYPYNRIPSGSCATVAHSVRTLTSMLNMRVERFEENAF